MQSVSVKLPDEMVSKLDELARQTGEDRSALIRQSVNLLVDQKHSGSAHQKLGHLCGVFGGGAKDASVSEDYKEGFLAVIKSVLLDAGPWVAYLRRADKHHVWARDQFSAREAFVSCEAVLAEVCARLQYHGNDPSVALEFVRMGVVRLDFDLQTNLIAVEALMRKYRDRPMDLADACLVRMTELEPRSLVVTTDKDFKIYRRNGREMVPCVLPT